MANDEYSGAPTPTPDLAALQARLDRLEQEVASLRLQVQDSALPSAAKSRLKREQPATAPPPPRPGPAADEPVGETPPRGFRDLVWPESSSGAPAESAPAPAHLARSHESLESRLGSQYFNRIAILLLLIGTAYGMKMAVDRGLIGPGPRVLLGLLAGAGLIVWSEQFRRKGFAAFSYSLKALGSGVLYLALWAAFRLYGLIPAPVALTLMVLVTAWNAYMAWAQDAELLAGYALAGGFATPTLLSTGGNHEIFLFTYLLAIDVATVALVRLRRWPRLLLAAFPLTVGYFIGWYVQFFAADEIAVTSAFIALFAAVFASVPLWPSAAPADEIAAATNRRRMGVLEQILLPLANAAFAALAYYSVLQDSGRHGWLPWLMLVLAAVYLGIMRLPQSAVASAIHLSIAVVFLTIAIPLKASGHWITVGWLVEGLALTWVATRLVENDEATAYAAKTLRWLGWASLLLGFAGVVFHIVTEAWNGQIAFVNSTTGTALVAIAVFACASWLAMRAANATEVSRPEWLKLARSAFGTIATVALILSFREFMTSWDSTRPHPAFANPEFATALLSLAVFAGVVVVSTRVMRQRPEDDFWSKSAASATILFNFVAVLTGVREVDALFAPAPNAWTADAVLQQSLAISGFLMLYGAALLAVGFWRRSGFLRWQALALLLFTILKAFLYDMRNLSQGYRVVSLMALGALLLAVSFAYQKDWLNLKGTRPISHEQDAQ